MGTLTISMAIFNSYVKLPEGTEVFISSTWMSESVSIIELMLHYTPIENNMARESTASCSASRLF